MDKLQDWAIYTNALIEKWVNDNQVEMGSVSRIMDGFKRGRRYERVPENTLQQPDFYCPEIRSKPWHDKEEFAWVKKLENNFDLIKQTYNQIENITLNNIHPENNKLAQNGNWNSYYFYRTGMRYNENHRKCSELSQLIDSIEGVNSAGSVYFARLTPGAKIKPHYGPHNFRIRCHVGLKIPENSFIDVGGIRKTWEVGKGIVFDDSFIHYVENNSDQERVVFILDVWHPDLNSEEIALIKFVMNHHIDLRKRGVVFENTPSAVNDFD